MKILHLYSKSCRWSAVSVFFSSLRVSADCVYQLTPTLQSVAD